MQTDQQQDKYSDSFTYFSQQQLGTGDPFELAPFNKCPTYLHKVERQPFDSLKFIWKRFKSNGQFDG